MSAALSGSSIAVVKATAGVVAAHALEITRCFYDRMLTADPAVQRFFNKAHQVSGKQPIVLADAVVQYALHIDKLDAIAPLVDKIAHRHCALSVLPEHYGVVHKHLMAAVAQVLGPAVTPEVGAAWSEAVSHLAGVCIAAEERLYKQAERRVGGWRLEREFAVVSCADIAEDTKLVRFKAADGYAGKFEYEPGQYITLRIGETGQAPRHYCLARPPLLDNFLEVAVRRVPGGVYSNYVHDRLREGDRVMLGAPHGSFGAPKDPQAAVALVGAGIGVVPMRAMLHALGPRRVKAGLMVDTTRSRAVFRDEMLATGAPLRWLATREGVARGRPDLRLEARRLVDLAGVDAHYLLCGPTPFMRDMQAALAALGATRASTNVYGTGTLATDEAAEAEAAARSRRAPHALPLGTPATATCPFA
jgi:nitric oxide dioxygenase